MNARQTYCFITSPIHMAETQKKQSDNAGSFADMDRDAERMKQDDMRSDNGQMSDDAGRSRATEDDRNR